MIGVQQARKFQRGKELQGDGSEPECHNPRPEDNDSTTHIDLKLHAFFSVFV